MTPAVVDVAAQRRYAGDRSPVAIKQMAQEDLGAHPDHAGAKNGAKGAAKRWVDDHSSYGGARYVDGEVPMAVVDKLVKQ